VAALRELGFDDPIMLIAKLPRILSYARERFLLCGRIVMRLPKAKMDEMLIWLIIKPRAFIGAVEAAQPRTREEIRAIIDSIKKRLKL
jgi:hypothetical protein